MLVLNAGHRKWWVEQLAFSPDGGTLAAPCGSFGVYLLPAHGGEADLVPLPHGLTARRVVFAPDGGLYAGHTELGMIRLPERTSERIPRPHDWLDLHFGLTPDGARLLIGEMLRGPNAVSRWTCLPTVGPAVPVWTADFPGRICAHPLFPAGGEAFVALETRPEGLVKRFARSVVTGEVVETSTEAFALPSEVVLAPDGRLACYAPTRIHVYPGPDGTSPLTIRNDNRKKYTGLAFHPSGQYLAATSNDTTVKLYDTATWQLAKTFTWNVGRLRSVAFSPDGTRAAVGSDTGKVVVWDVDL
jgi:WD40 repeat protein